MFDRHREGRTALDSQSSNERFGERPPGARERILQAAYELFSHRGVGAVGVDAIVERAGVAKMSLYRHFQSKEGLVLAFMDRRARLWKEQWLETEVMRRAVDPEARLLAIFDVFAEWFHARDFEGCAFINVLLESEPESPVRTAAAEHLASIRAFVEHLARQARLDDPAKFARTWHILMKGSIVAAGEGQRDAARDARKAGALILQTWPRARSVH